MDDRGVHGRGLVAAFDTLLPGGQGEPDPEVCGEAAGPLAAEQDPQGADYANAAHGNYTACEYGCGRPAMSRAKICCKDCRADEKDNGHTRPCAERFQAALQVARQQLWCPRCRTAFRGPLGYVVLAVPAGKDRLLGYHRCVWGVLEMRLINQQGVLAG